jgi:outer membrane receptor protein involved in Fe transport
VFGRVNYNWKNLIMATAAFRYEGSTKFGVNNKFGMFPSASVAWDISNMDFMEQYRDIVQSLKLRVSYGVAGRSDIDSYLSLSTYSTHERYNMDGNWVTGYRPSVNANPDLKWERSKDSNIGVDFVLLDRLSGSLDIYDRQSVDLLYDYTAPQPPFLYSNILVNVGTIQNRGVELMLDYDVFERGKALRWNTGVIWSTGQTRLTKLSSQAFTMTYLEVGARGGLGASDYFFRVGEGQRIGQFYGYEATGLDENGNILVYNENSEIIPINTARAADKRYLGNGTPRHYLSWTNRLEYKNFDLSFLFTGAFGHMIYNELRAGAGYPGSPDNVLTIAYTDNFALKNAGGVVTSYFLEKGNYFKLENATLGYNFNLKSRTYVDNLRLYVTARNIHTFTAYTGNDPALVRQNGIEPGRDGGLSARYMGITFGVTMRFK